MSIRLLYPTLAIFLALTPPPSAFAKVGAYLERPETWFHSEEAKTIGAHVLSYQSGWGGWPKNTDTSAADYKGDPLELYPTFDNGATTDELRFLARLFNATKDKSYREAFERGLDYVLVAQYPTGGWPQSYPPDELYHREITFNDNAMVRVLEFVRETYSSEDYAFIPEERKAVARDSFARGIDCILKCQVAVDGKPTAWCAQHDEEDYSPKPARSFELATLSGSESVGITRLLMSVKPPNAAIVRAVDGAVEWFNQVALHGIKLVAVEDAKAPKGRDKRVVNDPSAPRLWARFYEIGTNQPVFSDRNGAPKHRLDEISYERRNGYSWLGPYARKLLEKEHPKWKAALPTHLPPNLPALSPQVRIALAGDITMTDHAGWAFGFKKRLTPRAACLDLAGSGGKKEVIPDAQANSDVAPPAAPLPAKERSEYLSEEWWSKLIKTKPRYVLLQFRGNEVDSKDEAEYVTALSRKITEALAKAKDSEINPVLVSALPRWEAADDSHVIAKPSKTSQVLQNVAEKSHVPLIDLYALSAELIKPPEMAKRLFSCKLIPPPAKVNPLDQSPPQEDSTSQLSSAPRYAVQLNPAGREAFGALVAAELCRLLPELQPCFR